MSTEAPRGSPPLWARALDALAIVGFLIAGTVLISGGFVLGHLGSFRISSHSVARPLLFGLALVVVRHTLAPAFPLHRRVVAWFEPFAHESPRTLAIAAAATRLAVLLVGYVAVLTIGVAQPVGSTLSPDPLVTLPGRYDAGWYGMIALEGYQFDGRFDTQQTIAFFPAFPMLLRAAGYVAGAFEDGVPRDLRMARALWAGVVLSICTFVWAMLYFARLARDTIDDAKVPGAVALLAAYPFAVFYSAPYSESLFLLTSVAAFYHFRRRQWLAAAMWGVLAGLTRPNGCLLSLALAGLMVEHLWKTPPADRHHYPRMAALGAAAAPIMALAAHSAYVQHITGAWFGWAYVHRAWGRTEWGLSAFNLLFDWIQDGVLLQAAVEAPVRAFNALAALLAAAMIWPAFRYGGPGGAVLIVVNVLPPLLAGGVLSMGRFTSTLFPIFLALAAILPRTMVAPVVISFAVIQGLASVLFFTWRELF